MPRHEIFSRVVLAASSYLSHLHSKYGEDVSIIGVHRRLTDADKLIRRAGKKARNFDNDEVLFTMSKAFQFLLRQGKKNSTIIEV